MPTFRCVALLAVVLLSWSAAASAMAGGRIALVVGNGAYRSAPPLSNPRHDATDIAAVLRDLSFEVIEGIDLDLKDFAAAVRNASERARDADVVVFFYAGHGLQIGGANFLLPVDAQLAHELEVPLQTLKLDSILAAIERHSGTTIVFLDACRDNPLARSLQRRIGPARSATMGTGLAPVRGASIGTFIAFSTAPDHVALDGIGTNSPFTEALKRHIGVPGRDLGRIMIDVRNDVIRATGERQVPWEHSSLRAPFYFREPAPDVASIVTPEPAVPAAGAAAVPCPPGSIPAGGTVGCLVPGRGAPFRDCPSCPEMVLLPAGQFDMGSPDDEEGRDKDEGPVHAVTFDRPFAVGVTPVTRGDYARFVAARGAAVATGCHDAGSSGERRAGQRRLDDRLSWRDPGFSQTDAHPVVCVSYDDAVAYSEWLSAETGEHYRLASEAELEYAIRSAGADGSGTGRFHFGSESRHFCRYGNGGEPASGRRAADGRVTDWTVAACTDGYEFTSPAGQFLPNRFGVKDAHGNVWSWTADCWSPTYDRSAGDGRAVSSGDCERRALRGGSWASRIWNLRSAARVDESVLWRANTIGFRLARDVGR